MAAQTPIRAADFIDSVGINTHLSWGGSTSAYANRTAVLEAIDYLGVSFIRDGSPTEGWTMPLYRTLADKGIQFNIVVTGPEVTQYGSYAKDLQRIETLLKTHPDAVVSIEGLNEINMFGVTYNGVNTAHDISIGRALQAKLHAEVNARALLDDIPILNLSVGGLTAQEAAKLGDLTAWADYGNWHVYFGNGDQPGKNIESGVANAKKFSSGDPVQITEANYYTAVHAMEWGGGGVTEEVQAKLNLNLLLDAKRAGVERTYLYELMDNSTKAGATSTVEGSLGLFHSDGTPKKAATAIRNLLTILEDEGGNADGFATKPLDFSVSGLPSSGRTMLMQESNGNYDIAIWAEPDIWNEDSRTAISAPNSSVTVNLGKVAGTIKVYDPLIGTSPIATASNTSKITVNVSDHPLIVEVIGVNDASAAAPIDTDKAGLTQTIGSGSDSLSIRISQDAWNGDAQYAVYIDGKQVGSTFTAHSLHNSGVTDTLTVKGDWGGGVHTAEVRFLNDAWGGTPTTDRNLYVESATIDGVSISGAAKDLKSPGSATFTFTASDSASEAPSAAPAPAAIVLDGSDALTGALGNQSWGGVSVTGLGITGSAARVNKTADGLAVQGSRFNNQIDHDHVTGRSEAITLDFDTGVDSATIQLSRMVANEHGSGAERGAWKAYNDAGVMVAQGIFDPTQGTKVSDSAYSFSIDPAASFSSLEISATGYAKPNGVNDSSDFALAKITYHPDAVL